MRYINANRLATNVPLVKAYFEAHSPAHRFLRVFFQDEHNLVLPGGRSVGKDDPFGAVASIFDLTEKYHVRVVDRRRYYSSDVVIEYNRPNVENIRRSDVFPAEILGKIIYAPSLPFEYCNDRDRGLSVITNVINEAEPRRARLIRGLRTARPDYRNVQGVYDLPKVRDLYSSTKILVNAHQTRHHHSIEEFRVLPALSRGCVVVSEDVPLREEIPYHEYVVWCDYESIPEVASEVARNYEEYFEKIHGDSSGLPQLLRKMKDDFEESMRVLLADEERFTLRARLRRRMNGFRR